MAARGASCHLIGRGGNARPIAATVRERILVNEQIARIWLIVGEPAHPAPNAPSTGGKGDLPPVGAFDRLLKYSDLPGAAGVGRFFHLTRTTAAVSAPLEDNAAANPDARAPGAELSDAQLIEQTMAGRRQAFDELIRRHQRRALAVSYRLLGNAHDAAEVTQDAFLKAYASLKTLEDPKRFGGWLMRIVSNLSLNKRRARRSTTQLPVDDLLVGGESGGGGAATSTSRADDPHHQAAGHELGDRVKQALEQLPEKQRLALVLFTIEQLPQKEVAEAMGCSVEAVKWHVFEGRRKLRQILKDLLTEQ
jgi:RNA polymerase sigma-70 factor, ECF subfamily